MTNINDLTRKDRGVLFIRSDLILDRFSYLLLATSTTGPGLSKNLSKSNSFIPDQLVHRNSIFFLKYAQ